MSEPTTVSLAATKIKHRGIPGGVSVQLDGTTVTGYGKTLADAKTQAVEALFRHVTMTQEPAAATVYQDGADRLITVYYAEGDGTGTLNILVPADGPMRITCTGNAHGFPRERAVLAAQQENVTLI